ncbi:MAG: hypothetical protein HYY26_04760 [Acidobacteria bacterium]|nr:hypothetical protein [Acidobacteriota bacterium]
MRRVLPLALGSLLFSLLLVGAPDTAKKETLRCTLTNTKLAKCCCQPRGEKLYCPLAKKTIDKCCCERINSQ